MEALGQAHTQSKERRTKNMKLHFITALLGIGMSATSLAAEAFRVYAPANC